MFNAIQDYTLNLLPLKRKTSQGGWLSVNAVCCHHFGHNPDSRSRGGVKTNPNGGITWHCFNCQFKTSYTPGRPLSFKYRRFLKWLGADDNDIQRLVFEALRLKEIIKPEEIQEEQIIEFEPRSLPQEAQSFYSYLEFGVLAQHSFVDYPNNLLDAITYVNKRKINLQKYDFYWTPEVEHKLCHRVIVPFYYNKKIVGYTARTFVEGIRPKYHSDHPSNFVFNLDNQLNENKFVIVCEGAFDAMSIDGVAVLSNDISEQQADLIEALGKKVIVVPDFDKHINVQNKSVWPGRNLVYKALEYNWSVSFPVWAEKVKDTNDAVIKFGKLFTIKSILEAVESNPIKIKLLAKSYE